MGDLLDNMSLDSSSQRAAKEVACQDHDRYPNASSHGVVEKEGSPGHPIHAGQERSVGLNAGDEADY